MNLHALWSYNESCPNGTEALILLDTIYYIDMQYSISKMQWVHMNMHFLAIQEIFEIVALRHLMHAGSVSIKRNYIKICYIQ